MLAKQVYFMLVLEGAGSASMAIKPYYILPNKAYDATELNQFFGVKDGLESDKWNRFGVSIMFYNGAK